MEKNIRRTAADRRHSASRELVLREVERGGSPSVSELATATGLHENTVRGHLARLRADGHVRVERETASAGPGRPALRWTAVPPEAQHPYAGLAAALADALSQASPDAGSLARAAGLAWGAGLAAECVGTADTHELVLGIMREQGFAPELEPEGAAQVAPSAHPGTDPGTVIELRRCPLLAAASHRPEVVCAVHEGMIEGIAGARSPGSRATLEPFALPGACLLHLSAA